MPDLLRTGTAIVRPGSASTTTVAALGYHEVTDRPFDTGFQRRAAQAYKHTLAAFGRHLDAIQASGLRPTLVTDIDLAGGGHHLVLTFDDGGKSARRASEILGERGWQGHFLVTTRLIGSPRFLDAADIRAIRREGHIVGSHSHTHPDIFNMLSPAAMRDEWRRSCDILAQLLGEPCIVASVPGGDISCEVLASADLTNIRYLLTSEPWLTPRRVGNCWVLGRYSVKRRTSAARVEDLLAFRGWGTALLARQTLVLFRNALHPLYRAYVEIRTREPV